MIAVIIEFYPLAYDADKLFRIIQHCIGKLPCYICGNIGWVACFNVKTVQHRTFAYPLGKLAVKHCCLLAEPCQVMSIEEMVCFIEQERFERLFHRLLAMKYHLLVKPFVIDKDFCGQKILICMIKPVVITLAVGLMAVVSAHKALLPHCLCVKRKCSRHRDIHSIR